MSWETVIGLEVHAQLLTKTKLFCSCPISFGEEPNTKVCPICLGLPGSLPVLNAASIELAIKAAASLHCRINEKSVFARKNYFYPDLPKGYQISQYDMPLAEEGWVQIDLDDAKKKIGIIRVHMEEDAGKLLHEGKDESSRVDYNRSCVPLIEIVSKPDLSNPIEATEYLKMLRLMLVYNGICDGNMELGNFRCDANISIRKVGDKTLGTKTELKNMNSFNFIQKALDYESKRQIETLEKGGKIFQETLLWDQKAGKTVSMRSKEEAHDYRYFSEPDLLPLVLENKMIEKLKADQGIVYSETLGTRGKDLISQFKIDESKAQTIIANPSLWALFTKVIGIYAKNPQRISAFLTDILPNLKGIDLSLEHVPGFIAKIVEFEDAGRINLNTGKDLLEKSLIQKLSPEKIIETEGLVQLSDQGSIDSIIDTVLAKNASQVAAYKNGKENLFNYIFGQLMKESKGKLNIQLATERLKEKLKK
jgi:aspartyl-tRNA(Asn)/glutamyl-tRNA(Gln) amidotransferase subunit B